MSSPISLAHKPCTATGNYNPPTPVSPLFKHLHCSSNDDDLPSSPPSVHLIQGAFPSLQSNLTQSDFELSPSPVSRHALRPKRKPYEDSSAATRELLLGFQDRIAHLESSHTQISVELDLTRDALIGERKERKAKAKNDYDPSPSVLLTDRPSAAPREEELTASLKMMRSQNAVFSRTLREREANIASLKQALEVERNARLRAEEESTRLLSENSTLLEHNRLLANRDSALQEDISSLVAKSYADDWMRKVLEAELDYARQIGPTELDEECRRLGIGIKPVEEGENQNQIASSSSIADLCNPKRDSSSQRTLGITIEHPGVLRSALVSAKDELAICQSQLAATEQKSALLSERIESLQRNITLCVDESARVLEVERELRGDVEVRLHIAGREISELKESLRKAEAQLEEVKPLAEAWSRKIMEIHEIEEIVRRSLPEPLLWESDQEYGDGDGPGLKEGFVLGKSNSRRQRIRGVEHHYALPAERPQHRRFCSQPQTSSRSYTNQDSPFITSTPNQASPLRHLMEDLDDSPYSTTTLVATPSPLANKRSHSKRVSGILAATLSRNQSSMSVRSALKSDSSLFVDVTTTETTTLEDSCHPPELVDPTSSKRSSMFKPYMKRASAMFVDFAQSYGQLGQGGITDQPM